LPGEAFFTLLSAGKTLTMKPAAAGFFRVATVLLSGCQCGPPGIFTYLCAVFQPCGTAFPLNSSA
jgi:hypothetical protein